MQQKQRDLLHALYEKHQSVLRNVASAKGLPPEDADDAVEDTFVAFMTAYLKDADGWDERHIKAKLMKILRNRCVDYYRRINRCPIISLEEFVQNGGGQAFVGYLSEDLCGRIILREDLERVRAGILSLSREMQDVAVLHLIEGNSLEEVCDMLHISKTTCRMRIFRIRKYLREWLDHPEMDAPKKRGRPKGAKSVRKTLLPQTLEPILETNVLAE